MTSPQRTRLATVLTLLTVMVAGFLLGIAWDRRLNAEPARSGEARNRTGRVIDGVGLSPAQDEKVEAIVAHFRTEMERLNDEFRRTFDPLNREIIQSARDSLKSVLTPNQVELYDSLLAEYDVRRAERRRGRRSERE